MMTRAKYLERICAKALSIPNDAESLAAIEAHPDPDFWTYAAARKWGVETGEVTEDARNEVKGVCEAYWGPIDWEGPE